MLITRSKARGFGVVTTLWKLKWWLLHNSVITVKSLNCTLHKQRRGISRKIHNNSATAELCLASQLPHIPSLKATGTFREQSESLDTITSGWRRLGRPVSRNTPDQAEPRAECRVHQLCICTGSLSSDSVKRLPGVYESEMLHILIYHLKQ